jgi:hypothetical protein
MAGAVVAAMVLTLLLPDDLRLGPRWLLPLVEGLLLVTLIAADPGRISRRSAVLRLVAVSLVTVLAVSAIWSTTQLIHDLVQGGAETNSASALLQAGGSVWASTVLTFALLYFELDSGGAAARAHEMPDTPQLAFPQQLNPTCTRRSGDPGSSTTCTSGSPTRRRSALPTSCRWFRGPRSPWASSPWSHWSSSGS